VIGADPPTQATLRRPGVKAVAGRPELTGVRDSIGYVCRREHLRRTLPIALAVGIVLTAINQLGVLLSGHVGTATYVRCGLNFVVPFVVSNLGLLSGRSAKTNSTGQQ
jgi:hypothetical protein